MRSGYRAWMAAVALAAPLAAAGCAAPSPRPDGSAGSPAAVRQLGTAMPGKPVWLLTLGAEPAGPPPSTAPPFSVTDETEGRWLHLFELSYPAEPEPAPAASP